VHFHNFYLRFILYSSSSSHHAISLSRLLSLRLDIEIIGVADAVRYTLINDDSGSTKAELIAAIETKLNEGKKPPKKGEEVSSGPLDVAALDLSPSLCGALPPSSVRKAIAYTTNKKSSCLRKGFILDVWSSGIVQTVSDFDEMTRMVVAQTSETNGPKGDDGDGAEAVQVPRDEHARSIELLIEVQVRRIIANHSSSSSSSLSSSYLLQWFLSS
jgi:hypothetical protein